MKAGVVFLFAFLSVYAWRYPLRDKATRRTAFELIFDFVVAFIVASVVVYLFVNTAFHNAIKLI